MGGIKLTIIRLGKKCFGEPPDSARLTVRYWWVILLSMLLHRVPFMLFPPQEMVGLKRVLQTLSYVVLLWALSRNLHLKSIRVLAVGSLMNFAAVAFNGGLMPVSLEIRHLAHMTPLGQAALGNVLPEGSGILLPIDQTNLWFLTDIIPLPLFHGAYSPGDVLIATGFLAFVVEAVILHRKALKADARQAAGTDNGTRQKPALDPTLDAIGDTPSQERTT